MKETKIMAYRKPVMGRSYPFIYNVTMAVGSRKSVQQVPQISFHSIGVGRVGSTIPVPNVNTKPVQTASGEPNKRDDVMLVQYLLKRVYQQGHNCSPQLGANTWGDPHESPAGLKIDGFYGPKTARAIEQFQLEMRRNGRNIATDGCVDPEIGDDSVSSISKTQYSISVLNEFFWRLYPSLAPHITIDPECPPELRQSLGGF
jgi:hypothetical protein